MNLRSHIELANLEYRSLDSTDPGIEEACELYRKQFNLPADSKPVSEKWEGAFDKRTGKLVLIIGTRVPSPGYVQVCDVYPLPDSGRLGKLAIYNVLEGFKKLVALGVSVETACLATNTGIQRAIERVFGQKPVTYVYATRGAH